MPLARGGVVIAKRGHDRPAPLSRETLTILPLTGNTQLVTSTVHRLPEIEDSSHLCNITMSLEPWSSAR